MVYTLYTVLFLIHGSFSILGIYGLFLASKSYAYEEIENPIIYPEISLVQLYLISA